MQYEHPMAEHARSFAHREMSGELPDDVYWPDEDDALDPDHHEIADMVREQYAQANTGRRERRLESENAALRTLLTERGIRADEIDDIIYGER